MKLADKIKTEVTLPSSVAVWKDAGRPLEPVYSRSDVIALIGRCAELATAHDALMQQMVEALENANAAFNMVGKAMPFPTGVYANRQVADALRAYREQQ